MAAHNSAPFIAQAIESVLGQTFSDFELIIADDGSTDRTRDVANSYRDARIRLTASDQNMGPAAARNRAIRIARGRYIAIQDSDDVSLSERLQTQVDYMDRHAEVVVVGAEMIETDKQGNHCGRWLQPCGDVNIKWELLFRLPFNHPTLLMRGAALSRAGLYPEDPELRYVEDYDLLVRVASQGVCANLAFALYKYRRYQGAVCRKHATQQRQQGERVSRHAISTILGSAHWEPEFWPVVQKFLYSHASEADHIDVLEVALAIDLLERLHLQFSQAYKFHQNEINQHRRRVFTAWAKHCLGLALRKNSMSLVGRVSLAASAMRLLSKGCTVPARYRCGA